jgi:hypothetical protein
VTDFDDPAFFGDRWAARYEGQNLNVGPDPAAAVDFLAGLDGGPGTRAVRRRQHGSRIGVREA